MAELYREGPHVPADAVYPVVRTSARPLTLLPGHDPDWASAAAIAWGPQEYRTSFRALWNDAGRALRFDAGDTRPWHTMTQRDDPIWEEEAVEIFLDPARLGRHYAEVEISPLNVVTDLHILEPWPRLRGDKSWDWSGLESTVVPGACGGLAPGSWVALAWLPWPGLAGMCPEVAAAVPPAPGDRWRFNVFRIKRPNGPAEPERGAVYAAWSTPPGPSFHDPSAFRTMAFAGPEHGR
ncbi:MAG TPA: carbohydrate-binding family 9-like protein [Vicinamibacterales bacterium]|nr:carbohydrate-binding family 9-like protein [Vicinamibacterales bacterium]